VKETVTSPDVTGLPFLQRLLCKNSDFIFFTYAPYKFLFLYCTWDRCTLPLK